MLTWWDKVDDMAIYSNRVNILIKHMKLWAKELTITAKCEKLLSNQIWKWKCFVIISSLIKYWISKHIILWLENKHKIWYEIAAKQNHRSRGIVNQILAFCHLPFKCHIIYINHIVHQSQHVHQTKWDINTNLNQEK